jgi:hypothetical protein
MNRPRHRPRARRALTAATLALAAGSVVGSALPIAIAPAAAAVGGGRVLALTAANTIIGFDESAPGTLVQNTPITGLQAGEVVVGFDIRPATGELFAVGVQGTTGRMYTIDPNNGIATQVGAAPFSTSLPTGGTWALDVNPTVDRIRFVHSSGVNLRLNPLNGGLAATDTPVAPSVASAVAYDRSVAPTPSVTTLFSIDHVANTLNRIGGVDGTPSPNAGATTAIGALGVDPGASVGFDIAPQGDALATLSVGGSTGLYTIDLATGAASLVGQVGAGTDDIRDLALPRPPRGAMVGLTAGNNLLSFDAANPAAATSRTVTGLQPGESLVGVDVRPATGELIGVGLTGTAGRIYRIDPSTGVATQLGSAPFAVAPSAATSWSVDFNPTVDRIRFTNDVGDNYRLNPLNGALAATDTDVAPAKPSAVAYDRSVATTAATTLFAIDAVADTLNLVGGPDGTPSPNTGVTTPRGSLGVTTDSDLVGFDISPIGEGVATLSVAGSTGLYTVSLVSGAAELLGPIGDGSPDLIDVAFLARSTPGASQFTSVAPTRLLDTRSGATPAPGSTVDVQVTGMAGIPANATAVVLNATVTEAAADGFATVFPTGEARPLASNQNVVAGQTRANLVTVKIGAGGKVSMFTQSGGHMIADVVGYYAPATGTAGRFTALTPARLIDTRTTAKVAPDSTLTVPVLGRGGVPATGVSSVVVDITATETDAVGFFTAYASGTPRPGTSSLNAERAGSTVSNLAVVQVGADGAINVYSQRGAHVVVDVVGWYGDASAKGGARGLFVPVSPSRVLDTRSGVGAPAAALPIAGSIELTLAGVGGVPAFGASAAVVNLTAVDPLRDGYVTLFPSGAPASTAAMASSLDVDLAGRITPNLTVATLGTGGRVNIYSQVGGHLVVDVAGWFTA